MTESSTYSDSSSYSGGAGNMNSAVGRSRRLMGQGHRLILHADMNCFYASVECLYRPELRDVPMAVGGSVESRHGIILAKNRLAKACGVKTGEALWQARLKCPEIAIVPPDYKRYMTFSHLARRIYYDYTDLVEPFGPDEAWLDITDSVHLFGHDPVLVACEVSERIKAELGVTVSLGLAWNKIFAKFGSDLDGGDGLVVITEDNYQSVVWPRPVSELLYVGPATTRKLHDMGIGTIGELAVSEPSVMRGRFGKMGMVIWSFANGWDTSPVKHLDPTRGDTDYVVKSIGNGLTAPRDLFTPHEAKLLVYMLAESVGQRLRESGHKAEIIGIHVRHAKSLYSYVRQCKLERPTQLTSEIASNAYHLLQDNEPLDGRWALRSLGVRASGLAPDSAPEQLDLFADEGKRHRLEKLDFVLDDLRRRFGNTIVRRACTLGDEMSELDIKRDNVVHPVGFFAEEVS